MPPRRAATPILIAAFAACATAADAADQLRGEASAFLRGFADSPVDWMPWGDAAFARAKAEQRPVFLFVGSFASELAAAMRRQTFANPKSAQWMNSHFVCVIADRDERPDVAALFQTYVGEVKQLSGWPLSVWLTPELLPYEGATYLSPSEDWGAPGFLKLAGQAAGAWEASPAACRRHAAEAQGQLADAGGAAAHAWSAEKAAARLSAAAAAWRSALDAQHGGFGDPPRTPEPELLRFLLGQSPADRDAALLTLRSVAAGALRDPLDGGFFRYASDAAWRIPYPQKELSDQARLALAFLDGARYSDAESFGACARGALDYALGRLARPDGTFAATVDATADEHSGYYAWTQAEIDASLGAEAGAFGRAHAVEARGNVPQDDDPAGTYAGKNFLRCPAAGSWPSAAEVRLLALRDRRPAPPRDERASSGAHGLLLSALSRAGVQLGEGRYLGAAGKALRAVRARFLAADGSLLRFAGASTPAAPEDYAALALGCRDYAAATGDREAGALADRLLDRLDAVFLGPSGGRFFACASPAPAGLFLRPLAAGDPPSAECLAIAAGSRSSERIAAALSDGLEDTAAQAPGDQLLAIRLFAGRRPAAPPRS
jgi:uncharacterized protein YyaL (SSP411 family)